MVSVGIVTMELVSDGSAALPASIMDDARLVYPGKLYKMMKARSACAGRVVSQDNQGPKVDIAVFSHHGPSQKLSKVLAAVGSPEVPEEPVLALLDGCYYVMTKSEALNISGKLDKTV